MLNINSITNGIIIDHISPGNSIKIYYMLELDKADYTVALIMNAQSKKHGCKDMIKIENVLDLDLTALGVMDSNITINLIKDEKISEKINLELPHHVEGVLECNNPRCVSTSERNIVHRFSLVDKEKRLYKCDYCDHLYNVED